jgi:hypothetical protein
MDPKACFPGFESFDQGDPPLQRKNYYSFWFNCLIQAVSALKKIFRLDPGFQSSFFQTPTPLLF